MGWNHVVLEHINIFRPQHAWYHSFHSVYWTGALGSLALNDCPRAPQENDEGRIGSHFTDSTVKYILGVRGALLELLLYRSQPTETCHHMQLSSTKRCEQAQCVVEYIVVAGYLCSVPGYTYKICNECTSRLRVFLLLFVATMIDSKLFIPSCETCS